MPYASIDQLPKGVKGSLPIGAQRIWMNAYNYASANPKKVKGKPEQYAWGAVKKRYVKSGNKWISKQ